MAAAAPLNFPPSGQEDGLGRLSRRASSILSLGSNPSMASTTDLNAGAGDEPPPYSAVPEPQNAASDVPEWCRNDPRSASTESLLPVPSSNDARRTLLLVYLNSSPLPSSSSSLKGFPAHVHNLVSLLLADTNAVHTKIFPKFVSASSITAATDDLSEWLTPRDLATTDVVLLGNSLGGLVSAELAVLPASNPANQSPLSHRLIGSISFDTPLLGFHPHVSKIGQNYSVNIRSPVAVSSNASDGGATVPGEVPSLPSSNQHLQGSSSLDACVLNLDSLKQRYCRVRLLDEPEEASRLSMMDDERIPPRVRFANYHTACVATTHKQRVTSPVQRVDKAGFGSVSSTTSLERRESLVSVATMDTELPPYEFEIDDAEDDNDSDLTSEFSFDDLDDLDGFDDLDDPLNGRDNFTDADATLVGDEDINRTKSSTAQEKRALNPQPQIPAPPPLPPMPSEFSDTTAFKSAMKDWTGVIKSYQRDVHAYHVALRGWKKAERSRIRSERKAEKDAWKANRDARRAESRSKCCAYSGRSEQVKEVYRNVPSGEAGSTETIEKTPDQQYKEALQRLQQERKRAYDEHCESYKVACKGERSERKRIIEESKKQFKERLVGIKAEWHALEEQTKRRQAQTKEERKLKQDKEKEERKLKQDRDKVERKLKQDREKEERKMKQDREKDLRKLQQDQEKEKQKMMQEMEKDERKALRGRERLERIVSRHEARTQERVLRDETRAQRKLSKYQLSGVSGGSVSSLPLTNGSESSLPVVDLPFRPRTEIMFDAASQSSAAGPSSQRSEAAEEGALRQQHFPLDSKSQSPLTEQPARTTQTKMRTMCLLPPKDSVTGARDPCWIQLVIPGAKDEIDAHQRLFEPASGSSTEDSGLAWDQRYGTFVTDVAGRIELWVREAQMGPTKGKITQASEGTA